MARSTSLQRPLLMRLAALYGACSYGLFFYVWCTVFIACWNFPRIIPVVLIYTLYAYGTGVRASYTASWPTPLRNWVVWKRARAYFSECQLHKTTDLSPKTPYIFGYHPHGVLALGGWLAFGTEALGFGSKFPGVDVRVLTLNINFRAPFLREYLLLHGVCSVSREAILQILQRGKSVFIAIGGGSESLLACPGRYDLILRRRRGFVRCALQTGASLVPVLGFGEPEMFTTATHELPPSSVVRRFQRTLEKLFGFSLPLAYGSGVFLPWGFVPHPVGINVVVGAPIRVPQYSGEPRGPEFEALVDKYHAIYCTELQKLYKDHREKYAKGAADLLLVE